MNRIRNKGAMIMGNVSVRVQKVVSVPSKNGTAKSALHIPKRMQRVPKSKNRFRCRMTNKT
ncbi:hypothetical protein KHM19_30270 [Leptospira borgpetersenii]|nr:hypothetical protein KHM09_30210 [Leptospira borgpetersenii]GIM23844.1 hypothetical protein KHM19_30270 [Leptospira borgpetersenii]GIM27105.1 hypothetical protein KHM25_30300 [Leptospira borgpetersenii]